jgi:Methylase involved in ubiquinone/menaquinone biosynthesis
MDYYARGEERFGTMSSRLYSFGVSRSMRSFYSFIEKDIEKYKPKKILDVGAGPGDLALAMSKMKNVNVYCVDPSISMKKIAERRFIKNGIKNIIYELGSSRYIPFNEKFDVIVTTISFHHWKEKEGSIKYILNKLNKNGTFIVYEFCYDKLNVIQKMSLGKHSLSIEQAKSYRFKDHKKRVEVMGKIIKLSFANKS